MSECGISIGSGDDFGDGSPEFHRVVISKARKEYRCEECRRPITKGSKYERQSGKFDGDIFCIKTCLDCASIRAAFVDGAFNYGELWQEMKDYGFENFTHACLVKVETASAKQFLVDKWLAWKGLTQ